MRDKVIEGIRNIARTHALERIGNSQPYIFECPTGNSSVERQDKSCGNNRQQSEHVPVCPGGEHFKCAESVFLRFSP